MLADTLRKSNVAMEHQPFVNELSILRDPCTGDFQSLITIG